MLFVDWLEWIGNIMIPHSSGPGPVPIGSGRLLHLMTFFSCLYTISAAFTDTGYCKLCGGDDGKATTGEKDGFV